MRSGGLHTVQCLKVQSNKSATQGQKLSQPEMHGHLHCSLNTFKKDLALTAALLLLKFCRNSILWFRSLNIVDFG